MSIIASELDIELKTLKKTTITITIVNIQTCTTGKNTQYVSVSGFETHKKEELRLKMMNVLNKKVVSDEFHGISVLRTNPIFRLPDWVIPRLLEIFNDYSNYHVIVKKKYIQFHD
jgi:hypothetical protein